MLRILTAALVVASASAATRPHSDIGTPPGPERPVILLVHGMGVEGRDTADLRRSWTRALDEGVRSATGQGLLGRDDVRVVWYADALEEPSSEACRASRPAPRSPAAGWARDVGQVFDGVGTFMALAGAWMGGREGDALRALAGDLSYLGDDGRRCGAGLRLESAMQAAEAERRPVILITHSFGALVAWDHLRTRGVDSPAVKRWITVGSLLGHPELRDLLLSGNRGGLPDRVGSWVNVYDPDDVLSAPLVDVKPADDRTDQILDRTTEARVRDDVHELDRYLADPATVDSMLEAWCAASDDRTRASSMCGAFTDR